ncbi:hypothetical protein [Streptomyces flaveolus]|uniref:hypothetical protein n=1 Tax=Streptomyces flaveolus TaxID=67297 RepID=UPI0033C016EE
MLVQDRLFRPVGDDDRLVVREQSPPDPVVLGARQDAARRFLGAPLPGHALEVRVGAGGVP